MTGRNRAGALLVILSATALAYLRTLHGQFIFDDLPRIADNLAIKGPAALWGAVRPGAWTGLGRPLVDLTLALNYQAGELDPFGYHLVNVAIHLAAALAVWALARVALRRAGLVRVEGPALLTAACWALHPLQSQAVSYVIQRAESLASLCYLGGLLALLAADEARSRRVAAVAWLGGLLGLGLGLGAKAIVVTLPVAWLLFGLAFPTAGDAALGAGRALLRRAVAALPLIGLAGAFALSSRIGESAAQGAGFNLADLPPLDGLMTQARAAWRYLGLLALPIGQSLDHQFRVSRRLAEPDTLAAVLALAALLGLAGWALGWAWRRTDHRLAPAARVGAFGAGWFLLLLAPTSLVPIIDVLVEHRVYLASLGPILAAVVLADLLTSAWRPPIRVALAVAVAASLGLTLHLRNAVWESGVAVWSDAVAKAPGKGRPHLSLAGALSEAGDPAAALPELQQARALAADGSFERRDLWRLEAVTLFRLGRVAEARAVLEEGLAALPTDEDLLNNLAIVELETGRPAEAEQLARRAVAARPGLAAAWNTLGEAQHARADHAAAVEAFGRAVALDPDAASQRYNLAVALEALGRNDEACRAWALVVRRTKEPGDVAVAQRRRVELGCGPPVGR